MKRITIVVVFLFGYLVGFNGIAQEELSRTESSQWRGKKVAYLGDSMTQKRKSDVTVYWEYLTDLLGIQPLVYGISGHQWTGVYQQAKKLHKEHGVNLDAIFIFAGTNDYNHNTPLGEFYVETLKQTNYNGKTVERKYRTLIQNDSTFCGRINKTMAYLKSNFPDQQIVIMTPIHRGFARFNATNVQPEERFSNDMGLYLDVYVEKLKEAALIWAVPVIDLYALGGLYPLAEAHNKYFQDAETDLLHPNSTGNYRLAKTIQYQLLALPSGF